MSSQGSVTFLKRNVSRGGGGFSQSVYLYQVNTGHVCFSRFFSTWDVEAVQLLMRVPFRSLSNGRVTAHEVMVSNYVPHGHCSHAPMTIVSGGSVTIAQYLCFEAYLRNMATKSDGMFFLWVLYAWHNLLSSINSPDLYSLHSWFLEVKSLHLCTLGLCQHQCCIMR